MIDRGYGYSRTELLQMNGGSARARGRVLSYLRRMIRFSDFDALRAAINVEAVVNFDDMWRYVTARDLFKRAEMNPYGPALKRVFDPSLLTIEESDQLAAAIGVNGNRFFQLIVSSLDPSTVQQ